MWKYFWKNVKVASKAIALIAIFGGTACFCAWSIVNCGWIGIVGTVFFCVLSYCFWDARQKWKKELANKKFEDRKEIDEAYDSLRSRLLRWDSRNCKAEGEDLPVGIRADIDELRILFEQFQEHWGKDAYVDAILRRFIDTLNIYNISITED